MKWLKELIKEIFKKNKKFPTYIKIENYIIENFKELSREEIIAQGFIPLD